VLAGTCAHAVHLGSKDAAASSARIFMAVTASWVSFRIRSISSFAA
jgi:hypothetical protein